MRPRNGPGVTVVGAGIIGSSIARRLALGGCRVRLIDAGEAGHGATHAAAGMLAPGGEFDTDSVWLRLGRRSLELYPKWVGELEEETGLKIDFSMSGAFEYPEPGSDFSALAHRCERQKLLGIRCEMRGNVAWYPGDGAVDPRTVFHALLGSCRRHGVEIVEHQRIELIDDSEGPVVIAAGAWSGTIPVQSDGRRMKTPQTIPVKGHLIGYSLPPGSLPHILRSGHTYIVQRANGFTIVGSTSQQVGFHGAVDEELCDDLSRRGEQLWPELSRHRPASKWIGFRPLCQTGEPAIGRLDRTGIWLAYGHYRNGILLAPATAEILAEGILGL